MARPRDADRGDGLQIWRVVANILNKQSRAADRGWSFSLGLGGGLTTPHRKTLYSLRSLYKGLGNGRILWHDPSTGKRIWGLVRGMSGACLGKWLTMGEEVYQWLLGGQYIPEDSKLHTRRREDLKSHILSCSLFRIGGILMAALCLLV
jgi:hypothetical protein